MGQNIIVAFAETRADLYEFEVNYNMTGNYKHRLIYSKHNIHNLCELKLESGDICKLVYIDRDKIRVEKTGRRVNI